MWVFAGCVCVLETYKSVTLLLLTIYIKKKKGKIRGRDRHSSRGRDRACVSRRDCYRFRGRDCRPFRGRDRSRDRDRGRGRDSRPRP